MYGVVSVAEIKGKKIARSVVAYGVDIITVGEATAMG